MLLTVDVGNTNTVFAVFDGERLVFDSRMNTDNARMADQYAIFLDDILKIRRVPVSEIKGVIISSVVPPATAQVKAAAEELFGVKALLIGPGLKTGLNIKIDDPSSLGGDLACGAAAAKELYSAPCIVIDMGTIIKVMALDKSGALIGGTLSPGVRLGFEAMADKTAALPLVGVGYTDKTDKVIGTNTVDCIHSGVLGGIGCMLDGLINRFERELGMQNGECTVVATGGNASQIKPYCERDFEVNPHLVSQGLRLIYNKNCGVS